MISLPIFVPLSKLLTYLQVSEIDKAENVLISGVVSDSRQVKPGDLFVALRGLTTDGHHYIAEAIQKGARAIVGTIPIEGLEVPYYRVEDGRLALAILSSAFYGFPARKLTVIGVTGTDGKTTTSTLIYHILRAANIPVGMITTVNALIGDQSIDTGFHVTTPQAPEIQNYLAQMVALNLTHVVIEVTSHGLSQHRVTGCEFDVAVITNVTHEHLDYHGTYEAYREAKARLFKDLEKTFPKPHLKNRNLPVGILNFDDASYEYLSSLIRVRQVTYGNNPHADVRSKDISLHSNGLEFVVVGKEYQIPVKCHLTGEHNVSNCLAAIATTVDGLNIDPKIVRKGILAVRNIPGRMEKIELGQEFTALVDFAHTPNALQCSLQAARRLTSGRVIAVFGSAGLRDRAKRRMMAEISIRLADLTIFTAEDPRTESLEEILEEMARGAVSSGGVEGKDFWRIPDRGEAIRFALSLANPGDVVIVCGKGHEQSMCFGEIEYPWDDRVAMRAALAELLGIPGPKMPYLPTQG